MLNSNPFKTFHHFFEEKVHAYPHHLAVVDADGTLISYHDLNIKINQLAQYLLKKKLPKEARIGVFLNNSIDFIVSILAILKSGLAYVPLDPNLPLQRLNYFIENSQTQHIITNYQLHHQLADQGHIDVINLDKIREGLYSLAAENLNLPIDRNQLAYIIYTSGSTGLPKGVAIEHKGLPYCMLAAHKFLEVTTQDRIALYAPISFDANLWQIMLALGRGATLYVIPHEIRLNPQALGHYYNINSLSIAVFTPSLLNKLDPACFYSLRVILTTGEHVSKHILNKWHQPTKLIINGYGPTEVTIATSLGIYDPKSVVHVGKAHEGLEAFILDTCLNPVEIGCIGELYLAGEGLARGYWGLELESLNNEKFLTIKHPDHDNNTVRVFRTHDLAKFLPNKNIVIKGRVDRQVKVHGQLVSPEEIEKIVHDFSEEITEVYVDIVFAANQLTRINAYLCVTNFSLSLIALDHYLKKKLPHYMIPSGFGLLASFPITHHGKIDFTTLRATVLKRIHREDIITPRNEAEKFLFSIWQQVLNTNDFGINTHFDNLGGTSLAFLTLLTQVAKKYSDKLSAMSFSEFQLKPTIAALARKINRLSDDNNPLVEIQPGKKTKQAIFFIHDVTGNIQVNDLKFHLGPNFPIYGLKARGLKNLLDMDETIEEMALDYMKLIREKQDEGPYFIAGWSAGGIIAYEITNRFLLQGEQVTLCMIDSIAPHYLQNLPPELYTQETKALIQALTKILGLATESHFLEKLSTLYKEEQIDYAFNEILELVNIQEKQLNVPAHDARTWLSIAQKIYLAINRYASQLILNNNITLLVASQTAKRIGHPSLGWAFESKNIYTLDTDHFGIIRHKTMAQYLSSLYKL
ncbi:peptide synthetase, non-ribosomal [Legionella beliardensis]|uniref:Peptide synthetase, non-ribosomal n=1 Tax=Legionella beliardensis TaxID=91822 RepID=A0A378I4R1_9GAMM|nr:AMP-binding protein [Legionella beliardensis]STX30178.1 peptide synthetase, non-ribosomal [Legionella beliardensis]